MKRTFFIISLVVTLILFVEYQRSIQLYKSDKIYDLNIQYTAHLKSNEKSIEFFIDEVQGNTELLKIYEQSQKNKTQEKIRTKLEEMYSDKYKYLVSKGIYQLHFYDKFGKTIYRFHKPHKYGDDLTLTRPAIAKAIELKKSIIKYEVGKHMDGFRYIYPMFYKNQFVGLVEGGTTVKAFLKSMRTTLDSKYTFIVKKDLLESIMSKEIIRKKFHKSCINKNYYMKNSVHDEQIMKRDVIKNIKGDLADNIENEKSFVYQYYEDFTPHTLVFVPVYGKNNDKAAYLISNRVDYKPIYIAVEQFFKWLIFIIALFIIYRLYRSNRAATYLLEQYKEVADETNLVSKTDPKGVITYANEAFIRISGYSREELIGKPHNIVRDSSMPSSAFKDMWSTIKNGKKWHGKITNRAKNGNTYTVDASVFPIVDEKGEIKEYIAIRYDITELERLKSILEEQLDDSNKTVEDKMLLLEQYESAIDKSALLSRTDLNGIITHINETYSKVTGFSKKELIGHNHERVRVNDVPSYFYEELWSTIKAKKIWNGTIKNLSKNNKIIYLETTIVPILDRDNEVVEYMSIQYNVTDIYNLKQEIVDTQKEVIQTMGAIGESRSKETGNHVKRVAEYSKLLALKYGLKLEEAELLKQASPMHDIGKVGIPDAILNKPAKLNSQEWKVMQTHAELGYEMLKHSDREILKAAAIVAMTHHEKFDGSGYPKGLRGDEIHIYGRITAVADVFDALGSDRVYKKAWKIDEILELLKEEKGKHFDPILIDVFLENIADFLFIKDKYTDT